jgi:uncharacterized protein YaiL (DUF2058 family)
MSMSLREQLLAAGLGTKKQARQAEHDQRQEQRQQHQRPRNAPPKQTEQQKRAAQAQAAKAERDLELNKKRQEQAEHRARWAQVKQIIEEHRLPKLETDDYFNFVDRHKVRRMAVDAERRAKIIAGEIVIVRCEGKYDVVPADVAARIKEREERAIVSLDQGKQGAGEGTSEDDAYKDYVVPDDLMW